MSTALLCNLDTRDGEIFEERLGVAAKFLECMSRAEKRDPSQKQRRGRAVAAVSTRVMVIRRENFGKPK